MYSLCTDYEVPRVLKCGADTGRWEEEFVHEEYQSLCLQRKDEIEEMGNQQDLSRPAFLLDPIPARTRIS